MLGKKGRVIIEQNGLSLVVDDVCMDEMAEVGSELLEHVRLLQRAYPELRADLNPVPGGYPVYVDDDDEYEEGRGRIGFRPDRKAAERAR